MTESGKEGGVYHDAALSEIWNQRARKFGPRCVVNLAHPAEDFDLITMQQKQILFPLLAKSLSGGEKTLLDFGCGPGRFSSDLVQFVNGGRVVGFDVCQELLNLAPSSPHVHYTSSAAELESETYRDYFDVIWICLVLGGIPDEKCFPIARDMTKNLKSGGLLFLVEHTSNTNPGSPFWKFRRLDQYRAMFPQVALRKISDYADMGQEVTVMIGPKVG